MCKCTAHFLDGLSEPSAARCVRIVCDSGTVNIRVGNGTQYERITAARLSEKTQAIAERKRDKAERRRRIEIFLHMMEEQKEYVCFEPETFVVRVDKVITQRDGCMEFCFRNGIKCEYPQ